MKIADFQVEFLDYKNASNLDNLARWRERHWGGLRGREKQKRKGKIKIGFRKTGERIAPVNWDQKITHCLEQSRQQILSTKSL